MRNDTITNRQTQHDNDHHSLDKLHMENARREALIHALCKDYSTVFCVDLDTDTFELLRTGSPMQGKVGDTVDWEGVFSRTMTSYVQSTVHPSDRESMHALFSTDGLRAALQTKNHFVHTYRIVEEETSIYYQVKCVRLELGGDGCKLILGFRNINGEVRAEIVHKQLLSDALEQARCASHAKTAFLNNMSHDIRTPLNAIIGFTSLALSHVNDRERVEDYLHKIKQASNHLLSLINDVLDMSRIESGKMRLDEKEENLGELIQNLHDIVQSDIQTRQLALCIDMTGVTDKTICCDRLRLNQVLLNLLSNAMKFTNPGGTVSVLIGQYPSAVKDHAIYEFRVRDTGIGISREFAEHIFEPFTREGTSTVNGIQGTGLGMSITKNFVDMMGGTITVSSEPGVGTEFVVTLEFRLAANPRNREAHEEPQKMLQSLEGLRILLVEDNKLNTEIAVELLTEAGCQVETAPNGKAAVTMVQDSNPGHYDLVLMDIQMPVMNGYEAAEAIRSLSNPALAEIPIIAMTANAFAEDRQHALACGMDAHIAKPVDVEKLFSAIRSVVNADGKRISA